MDEDENEPPLAIPHGEKLFQIYDEHLADLESILPQLADRLFDRMDARLRTQLRRVQKILSDVRWNYGPPTDVQRIEP